jgi:ribonuclease D
VPYHDITTDEQLRQYCRKLAHAKTIAFDTEFVSEHTYRPVLCLIQIAADDELAVIDGMTVSDMTPFWEAIAAPGHETIVHAGRSEMEFCWLAIGRWPAQLFDVQIAAALVGAEYPAGLGALLSRFLDQMSTKHETRTDWRRRPLSKRQVEYALNDARYLVALRDTIRAKLEELGRLTWLDEEMAAWQEGIERSLSHERWRRVSGNAALDAAGLAIIRELYHWRDAEAQRRNQPVRRILRDDLIVELARRGSADPSRIGAVRGMERGDLQRRLSEIAAAIQRGLDLPEADRPVRAPRQQVPELSVLGQFLFAALGSICREVQLAPNLVGTPNDIREWIAYRMGRGRGKAGRVPQLAHGWRAEFVGRLFDDLLSGKLSVHVAEPQSDHPLAFVESERAGGEKAGEKGDGEKSVKKQR